MHKLPLENAQTPFPPFTCQRSPNNGRKRRGYQKDPDSGKRFWGFCFKKLEKGGSATRPSPVYRLAQTLNPKKTLFLEGMINELQYPMEHCSTTGRYQLPIICVNHSQIVNIRLYFSFNYFVVTYEKES